MPVGRISIRLAGKQGTALPLLSGRDRNEMKQFTQCLRGQLIAFAQPFVRCLHRQHGAGRARAAHGIKGGDAFMADQNFGQRIQQLP